MCEGPNSFTPCSMRGLGNAGTCQHEVELFYRTGQCWAVHSSLLSFGAALRHRGQQRDPVWRVGDVLRAVLVRAQAFGR